MNNKKTLSIIIPAYNEEDGIRSFIGELQREIGLNRDVEVELIVVNDGSVDRTGEIIGQLEGVTVLHHKHNYGYGAALKTGIQAAVHETVAIIDADNTYDCGDVFRLLPFIEQNDMVVGARMGKVIEKQRLRLFAKWFMKKLSSYLTQYPIPDLNSGLRIMDRSVVRKYLYLLPDGFSFTTTITLAILTNRGTVHYEQTKLKERSGRSKIKPIKDSMRFFYLILTTVLCFKPARIFIPISLFFFFLGIFIALFSIYSLGRFMDVTTVLCIITSLQFLGISLLAEQIVRLSKKEGKQTLI